MKVKNSHKYTMRNFLGTKEEKITRNKNFYVLFKFIDSFKQNIINSVRKNIRN